MSSANAFANGANQNCGNVMTGRSTTRLHAPPGGRTSINIFGGHDDGAAAAPRTSANKFANGSNQNCGNVLTDRSTTRLHHAPGGGSSLGAGGATMAMLAGVAPAPAQVQAAPVAPVAAAPAAVAPAPVVTTTQAAPAPLAETTAAATNTAPVAGSAPTKPAPAAAATSANIGGGGTTSANKFANGANQNCGNFITDRPTSRVLAPPGGGSNITFG